MDRPQTPKNVVFERDLAWERVNDHDQDGEANVGHITTTRKNYSSILVFIHRHLLMRA